MPDNSNCGEEDRKCPQKFQSHLKICDFPWTAGVCVYGFPSLPQPHVPQQTCQNDFQARVAKNFQSHLNICDYLEEVWQPTVTLYWNIWNSRKIILMSPKKEKLYYSKLWRKKERGKISFSNHKCVSCLKPTRSSTTLQNIFTFFLLLPTHKELYTWSKKRWVNDPLCRASSFLRSVDILY